MEISLLQKFYLQHIYKLLFITFSLYKIMKYLQSIKHIYIYAKKDVR